MGDNEAKKNFIEGNVQAWFFFIVFVAIFFRIFNITTPSLWTDELSTLWVSSAATFTETLQRASHTQGMHPGYFLLQHAVLSVLPVNEASLRGLSCVASILSVLLIFWLGRMIFVDDTKALLSSAIFAIHADSIYYAQEARPYALGIMFALLSQIFFMRLAEKAGNKNFIIYVISSVASVYMHYTFAALFLFQNIYVLLSHCLKLKKISFLTKSPPLKLWISAQSLCFVIIALSLPHISGMFTARGAWNWVRPLNFFDALGLFFSMFDLKILALIVAISLIFFMIERFSTKEFFKRLGGDTTIMLLLWLSSPLIFVFAASKILNVSFFDPRYMLLSMPAYYFLLANLLDIFRSDVLRTAFPGIYLILYLGYVSIPSYMNEGVFCHRISHDWRSALTYIKENYKDGDAILLRYGEVKENWIASTAHPIVREYVTAPFHGFYWKQNASDKIPPIFNMTYIWNENFYPYYDKIFSELIKRRRVWLIGVDPPNTNYRCITVAQFMQKEYMFKSLWDSNFSGVYLALLESDSILRQKALVPSYYNEIRWEMKKNKTKKKDNP